MMGRSLSPFEEKETEKSLSVASQRIGSLVRQLTATSMEGHGDLRFQPTAGSPISAFQSLEQAPEDPILGVFSFFITIFPITI